MNSFVYDCGSGKLMTGEDAVPLFLRDNGDEIIEKRGKELETFLKCLETYPLNTVILKDKTMICHNGGVDNDWFHNRTTKDDIFDFLLNAANHKVDGVIWNNGFLGCRWADTTINKKDVRIAFYSRKNDPNMFKQTTKDYMIMIICN